MHMVMISIIADLIGTDVLDLTISIIVTSHDHHSILSHTVPVQLCWQIAFEPSSLLRPLHCLHS